MPPDEKRTSWPLRRAALALACLFSLALTSRFGPCGRRPVEGKDARTVDGFFGSRLEMKLYFELRDHSFDCWLEVARLRFECAMGRAFLGRSLTLKVRFSHPLYCSITHKSATVAAADQGQGLNSRKGACAKKASRARGRSTPRRSRPSTPGACCCSPGGCTSIATASTGGQSLV